MKLKKVLAFSIGPIVSAFLGALTVPLLAWITTQETIGQYALVNTVVTFFILLLSLGQDEAYIRKYHSSKNKHQLFATSFWPSFVLMICVFLSLELLNINLVSIIWKEELKNINYIIYGLVTLTYLLRYVLLKCRMKEQAIEYSISQLIIKLLFLLIILFCWFFSINVYFEVLVLGYLVSTLIAVLYASFRNKRELYHDLCARISLEEYKSSLKYGIPLVFSAVVYWALTASDRLLLNHLSNFEQLSLYSVAMSFAGGAMIFKSIFSIVWAPTIFKLHSEGKDLSIVDKVAEYVLLISLILFSIFGLCSWLLSYVLPEAYFEVQYLVVLCVGFPIFYTLSEATGVGINLSSKTKYNFYATSIGLICNVLLNTMLIPELGAKGASIATIVSFWAFFLVKTYFASRAWRKLTVNRVFLLPSICVVLAVLHALFAAEHAAIISMFWALFLIINIILYKSVIHDLFIFFRNRKN